MFNLGFYNALLLQFSFNSLVLHLFFAFRPLLLLLFRFVAKAEILWVSAPCNLNVQFLILKFIYSKLFFSFQL